MASSRRKLTLLISAVVGAVVGTLALSVVPGRKHDVGPARLSAKTHLGAPYTVLEFPPLGTVRARTHWVPVSVELSLAELDIAALQDLIGNPHEQQTVRANIERGLRDAARGEAIRTILVAIVAGAIGGALLPWRKLGDVGLAAVGGGGISVLAVASVALSFDVSAFDEPKFSGALTRAPAVLRTLERSELTLSAVNSRFDTAATRLSELLELLAEPDSNPRDETVALLHVSDIHSNPLGVSVARQLAKRFDVDAIIDSGDLTSFGESLEANVARDVANMDLPYVYVPGNHDSLSNQTRIDGIDNVHLLHEGTIDVEGVTILGWRDPTFTVWDRISTEEANEIRTEEGPEIAEALEAQTGVDVLVVHDRRMAEASAGLVPLVLSGHAHERDTLEGEVTDFLTVGSTGATGLEFFVEGSRPYEAEIVYFRDQLPVAVDYITFEALGEEFEIDRRRLDDE